MQRVKGVEMRAQGSVARVRMIETEAERSLRGSEERPEGFKMACKWGAVSCMCVRVCARRGGRERGNGQDEKR